MDFLLRSTLCLLLSLGFHTLHQQAHLRDAEVVPEGADEEDAELVELRRKIVRLLQRLRCAFSCTLEERILEIAVRLSHSVSDLQ
jgi:hypothetical protein